MGHRHMEEATGVGWSLDAPAFAKKCRNILKTFCPKAGMVEMELKLESTFQGPSKDVK